MKLGPHCRSLCEMVNERKIGLMNSARDIIDYVVCCVGAFAKRFMMTNAQAYAYLRRFKGIDFLVDCYAAEHTLSIDDAVEDILQVCRKHGGRVV